MTAKTVCDIWNLRTWAVRGTRGPTMWIHSRDSWSHHDFHTFTVAFLLFPHRLCFLLFMACAHVAFCDHIEPHTDGDPSVLVEGGPCEISFEAPVHILQEPRREYHC